ncbi:MAG: beta-ketoacyl-[acyl-carrier-protein] synthase II [Chloroflexi bacterium]|nr:MAG: beta-ketoacyl-[acyl-carrier-protein] synthase II [Chloroflexota bacterium]
MARTRVVVTGLGALTPLGNDPTTFWEQLIAGQSGIGPLQAFDPSPLDVRIAAEVKDFDPKQYIEHRAARRMDRFSQFAVAAAVQALNDAGISIDPEDSDRVGVVMNTGGGGIPTMSREVINYHTKGPSRVNPFFIPLFAPNMAACQISLSLGIHGPVRAGVAACAAGSQALVDAYELLQTGVVDVVIAGGTEAGMDPVAVAAFSNMQALSRRNDEPQRASRPFDAERDGFVFGEGCGALILETEAHAKARGARVYCELAGGAMSSDAFHITAPLEDGSGAMKAMLLALKSANLTPEDVDYLSAHGTSTPLGDKAETLAIKRAFGDHAHKLAVSSIKGAIGHLVGAAGAVAAVSVVKAIETGTVPPTINQEYPDPDCDLDYVPNEARELPIRAALVNAFGFGGQNAVAVFRRYD